MTWLGLLNKYRLHGMLCGDVELGKTPVYLHACHLCTISALRVIDNGVGLPVHGFEENVIDFAHLAADQKAALPSQVQTI